jgi:hypothetical protein
MAHIAQGNSDPGKLSVEYLVDCYKNVDHPGQFNSCPAEDGSTASVNGCCGGFTSSNSNYGQTGSFDWVQSNGGLPTQADYGDYKQGNIDAAGYSTQTNGFTNAGNHPDHDYACKSGVQKSVRLTSYEAFTSESDMASYVCDTSAVSICVSTHGWNSYTGGVMGSSCGTSVDHCVQAFGLSSEHGAWIIRNQWGTDWGVPLDDPTQNCEDDTCGGYIFIKYGQNTCDITNSAHKVTGTESV